MLVDIFAYREWAKNLAHHVNFYCYDHGHKLHLHSTGNCNEADLTFLVGWSEIVPEEFYTDRMVIVLHPSPLPKYRGGSPIQHQILAGETESFVTLFKLDKNFPKVDSGPIYTQGKFSLRGDLKTVLDNIANVGVRLIEHAIEEFSNTGSLRLLEQDDSQATTFKRRTPEESEITPEELTTFTAMQLYNKIRALQDPYPNAFIQTTDGKLYITGASLL